MNHLFKSVLLAGSFAWAAAASTITLDFSAVMTPVNITAPNPPTTLDAIGGDPVQTISLVTMSYDPEGDYGRCGFDAGLGGMLFDFNCVGAQVSTAGVMGTTEGVYIMNFDQPMARLQFSYGMFSQLPVEEDAYMLFGSFSLTSSPDASDNVLQPGSTGTMSYNTGLLFDHAEFRFFPSDPWVDPNGILPNQNGQTLTQIFDPEVSTVPEPDSIFLFGTGICAVLGSRFLKHFRRKV